MSVTREELGLGKRRTFPTCPFYLTGLTLEREGIAGLLIENGHTNPAKAQRIFYPTEGVLDIARDDKGTLNIRLQTTNGGLEQATYSTRSKGFRAQILHATDFPQT